MKTRHLTLALLLAGCPDTKPCEDLAAHMAEVLSAEQGDVNPEHREKMIKAMTEDCVADPPDKATLKCMMGAQSSKAMSLPCDEN